MFCGKPSWCRPHQYHATTLGLVRKIFNLLRALCNFGRELIVIWWSSSNQYRHGSGREVRSGSTGDMAVDRPLDVRAQLSASCRNRIASPGVPPNLLSVKVAVLGEAADIPRINHTRRNAIVCLI
jgi:hypothetical protein